MAVFDGLGTALRLLRVERGLTQVQVAERSGIGKSLISRYEAEVTEPKLESLGRLLESLGSNLGELDDALRRVRRHRDTGDADDARKAGSGPSPRPSEPHRTYVVFEMRDEDPPVAPRTESEEQETLRSFRSMMRFLLREIPRPQGREGAAAEDREEHRMNG